MKRKRKTCRIWRARNIFSSAFTQQDHLQTILINSEMGYKNAFYWQTKVFMYVMKTYEIGVWSI